jgi:RimJ/RimL family protein N-acetyltransferase
MTPIWSSTGLFYSALERFLATRIWGKEIALPKGTAMGLARGRKIVAAILFNNYQPEAGTIELTAASDDPRWLTRQTLMEIFGYAFGQVGVQAVMMRADPANARLARICKAYGFTRHELPHMRGKGKAEAIYILTVDAWRGNRFHKENAHG